MVLGRGIWSRSQSEWEVEVPGAQGGHSSQPLESLSRRLSEPAHGRTVIVFEPRGMAHPASETPKVGRRVFASLARVRNEHPVVASESLGWGMEPAEPTFGGAYATLLHYEMTPGLVRLHDACARSGSPLSAAWSAYSACSALVSASIGAKRAGCAIFLIPGFTAFACLEPGKRAFRVWAEPMNERDWKVFSGLLGEPTPEHAGRVPDGAPGHLGIAVLAQGDPGKLCPTWLQVLESGRVERVFDLDDLAAAAASISRGHPANLAEAFPLARRMDPCLAWLAAAALISAVVLVAVALAAKDRAKADESAARGRMAVLERRLETLRSNRTEIENLRSQGQGGPPRENFHRAGELKALASGLPDAVTLTALTLGPGTAFRLEAKVRADAIRPSEIRDLLAGKGFACQSANGWVYDTASGTLVVLGLFEAPKR